MSDHTKLSKTKVGVRVTCIVCGRGKAPVGRSMAAAMVGTLCSRHDDCRGYSREAVCRFAMAGRVRT